MAQVVLVLVICLAVIVLTVGLTAANAVRNFISRRSLEPNREWLESFDFSRYDTMRELFAPKDFEFLKRQPGYSPDLLKRLRSARLQIAESYLTRLELDVRLLMNLASASAVHRDLEDDDFSLFLLRQELSFAVSIFSLRVQLKLMRFGLTRQVSFDRLLAGLGPIAGHRRFLALCA